MHPTVNFSLKDPLKKNVTNNQRPLLFLCIPSQRMPLGSQAQVAASNSFPLNNGVPFPILPVCVAISKTTNLFSLGLRKFAKLNTRIMDDTIGLNSHIIWNRETFTLAKMSAFRDLRNKAVTKLKCFTVHSSTSSDDTNHHLGRSLPKGCFLCNHQLS